MVRKVSYKKIWRIEVKKIVISSMIAVCLFGSDTITIEDAYQKALTYEAKVQSYGYQVEAKKEDIVQAKSRLYPQINLSTSATARKYTTNYGHHDRSEQYYTLRLSAKMPIYHPEYYNNIEQSELKYKYSDIYLKQLKQELAFNVSDAYMSIVRAKNSLFVANAYVDANRVTYQQIKKLYDKRLANKMDLLAAKVTYDQSKIKANTEKQNLRLAKFKFKNLTNIDNANIPKINLQNIDISELITIFKEEDLARLNLDIKKSKINVYLTKKEIKNSSYGHYPKVDLSASSSKYDASNQYTDYSIDSTVSITFQIPIYQGGYVESNVAKYRYLLSAANEDLKDMERKVTAKYEELMINLNTAKENIGLSKSTIASANLNLKAVKKGYANGLKNLIDVENAKVKLFKAKFELIDAVYTYIKSYTSLLNLYGNLNNDKLEQLDRILFGR